MSRLVEKATLALDKVEQLLEVTWWDGFWRGLVTAGLAAVIVWIFARRQS